VLSLLVLLFEERDALAVVLLLECQQTRLKSVLQKSAHASLLGVQRCDRISQNHHVSCHQHGGIVLVHVSSRSHHHATQVVVCRAERLCVAGCGRMRVRHGDCYIVSAIVFLLLSLKLSSTLSRRLLSSATRKHKDVLLLGEGIANSYRVGFSLRLSMPTLL
jgi:hypothetical protein